MPTSQTALFALDRERFAQALIERFGWTLSLLDMLGFVVTSVEMPRRNLNAAIAAYFDYALEAQAIRAPSNLQVAVLPIEDAQLVVVLREHGIALDGGRLTRQASSSVFAAQPFAVDVLQLSPEDASTTAFDLCCDIIDALLSYAPQLITCLETMRADDATQRAPAEHPLFAALRSGTEYGEEIALVVAGGRTIRTNAGALGEPWIGADYLRVCEPDGSEVGYWTHMQWGEEPVEVIGDVLACALRLPELGARA